MISRYRYGSLQWIDLESPTHKEVHDIAEEFSLEPLIAEELLLPSTKPRVEFHQGYSYVILHFPAPRQAHGSFEQEVDFVIGNDFLITTHYDAIDPLHKFSKVFEVNSLLDKSNIADHGFFLFFYMLKKMYREIEHRIDHVRHGLITIEQHLFEGHEVRMVRAISESANELLNLRQAIEPHREVLKDMEAMGSQFFGEKFVAYLKALSNEYYRVHNHIMRNTDSLHELRETNNSLLSTKENETMRTLTLMALLTFPLALFVAIFDINAKDNPIIGKPYDFWIIVGIVMTAGGLMLWYFKHRRWL
ncbi:MAG: hypothetical protein HYS26_02960 [Candidatus Kaiserbacteria bacterium]|nr:MAG: hypothetical protein HYS26_02960 [Candidatus Kaiserbacteria bacterium]